MATTNLDHTIQKFVQYTEQSFMRDFEQIVQNKQFIGAGKFKAQIQKEAETIYNNAKSSGLGDEEALEKLKKTQQKMINSYTDEYKQLLANHNKQTEEDAVLDSEIRQNDGYDIDPEIRIIGDNPNDPGSYATFFAGRKEPVSGYAGTNNTYSMCDMVCTIDIPSNTGERVIATLGKLQTLSYSIHQNKAPVRVIGNMNAKDYVFGQRTIAGSLIFAVFNRHWLNDIYEAVHEKEGMKNWHFIADEIPPFDITISFANEYGYDSRMAIYGVRLVDEGQTMSINDIYIENTYQYVATDIEILDTLNAWQTSNKLGRRSNTTAGAISPSVPRESGTGTPEMKGKEVREGSGESSIRDVTISVPDPIISLSEEQFRSSTKEELWAALQKAYKQLESEIEAKAEELKEGKTSAEQQKVNDALDKARQQLGQIYSRQYEEIREYYSRSAKTAAENKIEPKSVETPSGDVRAYTVRITGQPFEKAKEFGRTKAKQQNGGQDPEIVSEGYNDNTKQYVLIFRKTG